MDLKNMSLIHPKKNLYISPIFTILRRRASQVPKPAGRMVHPVGTWDIDFFSGRSPLKKIRITERFIASLMGLSNI